jgi:hypothetical protein
MASMASGSVLEMWVRLLRFSPWKSTSGAAAAARRRSAAASLRPALATQIRSPGLEALERGPGLQQGAIDGEVLTGKQVLLTSEAQDCLEEFAADVVLEQPLPVLGEGAQVEGGVLHVEVQEPLEEQVVAEPFAELALTANRVEGHQPAGLEQVLGWDRGATILGVHLIDNRTQLGEGRFDKRLHAPNRVLSCDEFVGGDREEVTWRVVLPRILPPGGRGW